jgi:hypothetical protein
MLTPEKEIGIKLISLKRSALLNSHARRRMNWLLGKLRGRKSSFYGNENVS